MLYFQRFSLRADACIKKLLDVNINKPRLGHTKDRTTGCELSFDTKGVNSVQD